jgi:hypothetical protein
MPRILVGGAETTRDGYFLPPAQWCVITRHYATSPATTPEALSCLLVHEATHARIERIGIRYAEGVRARIEVLCVREQLAFARALPGAAALTAQLESRLAEWTGRGEPPWSDARFQRDSVRFALQNGIPRRIVRFFAWLARRRAA